MPTYHLSSSRETKRLGAQIAKAILKSSKKRKGATVIALSGDLGAGKTTFTQGFFRGLGLRMKVVSPTFIIMRRTALKKKAFANVFHIDAYRLRDPKDILHIEFRALIKNPANILLIEWAEQIKKIIPKGATWITFHHGKKESERIIKMRF